MPCATGRRVWNTTNPAVGTDEGREQDERDEHPAEQHLADRIGLDQPFRCRARKRKDRARADHIERSRAESAPAAPAAWAWAGRRCCRRSRRGLESRFDGKRARARITRRRGRGSPKANITRACACMAPGGMRYCDGRTPIAEVSHALRAVLLAGNPGPRRVRPARAGRGRGRLRRCRARQGRHVHDVQVHGTAEAPALRAAIPQGRQARDRADRVDPALPRAAS